VFFKGARKNGMLSDNIELIQKAFMIDWQERDVIDVCVFQPDDVRTLRL